ncbi:MAG: MBL fold metallo-hydrolase [Woeseiaceae bacterium]|nr:MBL fold metallo-hydrolase [Woeseiaceae bacterium]
MTSLRPPLWTPVAALLTCTAVHAQNAELRLDSSEVVPGMYAIYSADEQFVGGTMALLIGEDGEVLIDAGIEQISEALLDAVAELAGDPVDFLINTHVHGDHVGSNAALHEDGATIVAHTNIRERLLSDDESPAAALPQITYDNGVTLHLNGFTTQVIHVPNAHTDGDSIIWFPDVNVIHAGDVLFNGLFPFIDAGSGGGVEGYLAAMSRIITLADNETKIIAGHGPVIASRADVQRAQNMIVDARGKVKALKAGGMSEDEVVAANPLAEYESWSWGFINTERMTRQMYQSL